MYVFEVTVPGTWLTGLADETSREASALLRLSTDALEDAAISLSLFEGARAVVATSVSREDWERERQQEIASVDRLRRGLPAQLTTADTFRAENDLYDEARIEAKRARWRAGQLPAGYRHRLPFLHAKSCVYAVDSIGKALRTLAALDGVPTEIAAVLEEWRRAFPLLVPVRNSAHHQEDRVRGKAGDKPLDLQPVLTGPIHAPSGGVLVIDMLNDNRYGGTLADGSYGEVEISSTTVATARDLVQRALNSFTWTGHIEHRPR